jgi:hypothetical protein
MQPGSSEFWFVAVSFCNYSTNLYAYSTSETTGTETLISEEFKSGKECSRDQRIKRAAQNARPLAVSHSDSYFS